MTSDDLQRCVDLNNAAVPNVSAIDLTAMRTLVEMSTLSLVVEDSAASAVQTVAGFCVNLGPGAAYGSDNYRWFCDRYDDFVYLDRIVVSPEARNGGIGAALYAAVEQQAGGAPWLLCEVNLRPRNDGSLRFHHRLGFAEVGQHETSYGILVSMLAKALNPPVQPP